MAYPRHMTVSAIRLAAAGAARAAIALIAAASG